MSFTYASQTLLIVSLLMPQLVCGEAELSTARETELNNMLVQDCGSCHGLTFKGGLGSPLLPEQLRAKPRDYLLQTIMEGRPGTAMPPWKYLLSQQEASWMLDQLLNRGMP